MHELDALQHQEALGIASGLSPQAVPDDDLRHQVGGQVFRTARGRGVAKRFDQLPEDPGVLRAGSLDLERHTLRDRGSCGEVLKAVVGIFKRAREPS